ncbi:integrase, catalytic region, zinc finger, CCHC-type containing protein [Tanacetum coccineum]|uniref:Integrase, catalytic region, zinc finger, CCHC-type containing protein n=1 Tax=Tanacetum coccineum TaxID=301880 RepID=A0ABQ4YHV9_9ASTR
MVPTKKVERMPYEIWHGKALKLSYLRSARTPPAPDRYGFYADVEEYELRDINEPPNYKALLSKNEFDKWLKAMNTEMQSMKDKQVWVLVDLSPNGRTVRSKWIFKKKTNMDGKVHNFKALLVAKCYTQTYGVDYRETFSLVADIRAIRILLAIVALYDYEIWQMDICLFKWSHFKLIRKIPNPKQEAEYIAAAEASMEAVWMRKFIDGLGSVIPSNKRPIEMLCDNEPTIAMANDPRILKGSGNFKGNITTFVNCSEKRLKIEKCNARIKFSKLQKEATYQVTLDALKLSPGYPTFLITAKICLILPNQDFVEPPSKDVMVPFIQELGYSGKCISGKTIGLDRLIKSRAQILWGMYNKKNVGFVALLWEDFMFQADNREISSARKENMPYPRFTKVIISHFISKDKTISMRNRINLHTVRDDTLLGTLKSFSKTQDYQQYRALIPDEMINQDIKDSKAYKTYLDFATGKATPKKERKFKKVASSSKKLSRVLEEEPAEEPAESLMLAKRNLPRRSTIMPINRGKGMDLLSEAELLKAAQLKKNKLETHKLHESGSSDEFSSQPKVPDESEEKKTSTDEGTDSDDDSNDDDSDDASNNDDDDVDSDAGEEEYEEECIRTPDNFEFTNDDEEYEELYKDVNVKLKATEHEEEGKGDAKMTDAGHDDGTQQTIYEQVKDDKHVILTTVHDT